MSITILSKKFQIVVPKDVRESMKLKKGEEVSLHPLNADQAILVRHVKDPVRALRGLGKDVWQALGGTEKYITGERTAWQK